MEHFWNRIYRLQVIKRWNTSASNESESVAEHCYYVAILANILAALDIMMNGVNVDMSDILVQALYHDAFECYTSHIVSPVKHLNDEICTSMEQIKDSYSLRLFKLLPEEYRNLLNCLNKGRNNYKYVEIADSIEAYCFCAFQVHLGNNDFNNKLEIKRSDITLLSEKYNFVKVFFDNFFDENEFELIY